MALSTQYLSDTHFYLIPCLFDNRKQETMAFCFKISVRECHRCLTQNESVLVATLVIRTTCTGTMRQKM